MYHVKTLDLTLEAAISMQMWERCLELGRKLEEGYKSVEIEMFYMGKGGARY